MLLELIQKAIGYGCNALDVEYEDGKQWVTAMYEVGNSGSGFSIAALDAAESRVLLQEMNNFKRRKYVSVEGIQYRLVISKYQSFMEWAYKIQFTEKRKG
jgi:hypothetical protein